MDIRIDQTVEVDVEDLARDLSNDEAYELVEEFLSNCNVSVSDLVQIVLNAYGYEVTDILDELPSDAVEEYYNEYIKDEE